MSVLSMFGCGPNDGIEIEEMFQIVEEAAAALRAHIGLIDRLFLEVEGQADELNTLKSQLEKNSNTQSADDSNKKLAELRKERETLVAKVSTIQTKKMSIAPGKASRFQFNAGPSN
mmetsp:Transcript_12376/g.14824  ORF Transcript_12376/g.14824 Transcript_12376/m.14824 type:complete len:116 (-) Transcript_12376:448-795(-)|eukprot:CAMPEP_0197852782 /NCGR_PEP_ID=MMETSP1438-20131217/21378_1 /TAXON_ID=1461541 /ORGANISM="Pterosperma sp., Strain CCMP1384" /LENGTH=115 /DNA_ID=CAMNT_0043466957 /DNA_START=164 /DNA_END=511 /DNA_ORIENTATION=-